VIARAWKAQLRLCGRFRRLDARKTSRNLVVTAIARELAGFVWAEMTTEMTTWPVIHHLVGPTRLIAPDPTSSARRATAAAGQLPKPMGFGPSRSRRDATPHRILSSQTASTACRRPGS
jgi:hypothetical protein